MSDLPDTVDRIAALMQHKVSKPINIYIYIYVCIIYIHMYILYVYMR